MTLATVIENFDRERPNNATYLSKVQWVSQLDHKIYGEILVPRGYPAFEGYSEVTDGTVVLGAPECFGEIYSLYLNMKVDYMNGEIARFNNSALLFNRMFKELADYVNRGEPVLKNHRIKAGDLLV